MHSDNLLTRARLATFYKKHAKYADLIAVCQEIIQLRPDDAQAWCNLGDSHAARNRFDEAVAAYEEALKRKPNYVVAWNNLGNVHHLQGRYEEAVRAYEKAIALNRDDATPWVWLCMAYVEMGEHKKAEEAVLKVQKRLPLVANMLNEELGRLENARGSEDVHPIISRLTRVSP
jgi:tetratricopeptide (TPR) repeat protein